MKRADLKVGEAYWYARGSDWLESLSTGQKAVVVDTGCWEQPSSVFWRDREPRKVAKGNGVLVDLYDYGQNTEEISRRVVVNLTQIRGPYEETRKRIEESTEKRRERLDEQKRVRDEITDKIQDAIAQAAELGIKSRRTDYYLDEISVPTAEFVRLLNMIKK